MIRARLSWKQGKRDESFRALEHALVAHRTHPWVHEQLLARVLPLLAEHAAADPARVPAIDALLREPFAVHHLDMLRIRARLDIALAAGNAPMCVDALTPFREHPEWRSEFLLQRLRCYALARHPLRDRAAADLEEYVTNEGPGLGDDLLPPPSK